MSSPLRPLHQTLSKFKIKIDRFNPKIIFFFLLVNPFHHLDLILRVFLCLPPLTPFQLSIFIAHWLLNGPSSLLQKLFIIKPNRLLFQNPVDICKKCKHYSLCETTASGASECVCPEVSHCVLTHCVCSLVVSHYSVTPDQTLIIRVTP